jgi:glutaredoxin
MLVLSISVLVLVCAAVLVYFINTIFSKFPVYEKVDNTVPGDIKGVPLITDRVVVLSRSDCPYCTDLENKLKDYTGYTIISFNSDKSLIFPSDFSRLPIAERESITNTVDTYIKDSSRTGLFFPTIFSGSDVTIGLPDDKTINKIFKK